MINRDPNQILIWYEEKIEKHQNDLIMIRYLQDGTQLKVHQTHYPDLMSMYAFEDKFLVTSKTAEARLYDLNPDKDFK